MSQSARLGLGFLQAAQLLKEMTVNEGLAALDIAVSAAVDGVLIDAPPADPAIGSCFIVGGEPEGAWAGHALSLAGYTGGGWRFVAPVDGLAALDKPSGQLAIFTAGAWEVGHVRAAKLSIAGDQVVGPRLPTVAEPVGGTVIDAEARSTISAILARLEQHGLIEG